MVIGVAMEIRCECYTETGSCRAGISEFSGGKREGAAVCVAEMISAPGYSWIMSGLPSSMLV